MPHVDVVVIDGPNFAHRAWYACGEDAYRASVHLTSMVRTAVRTHSPFYAAVAWDSPTSWRTRLFPGYKQSRADKDRDESFVDWLNAVRGLSELADVQCVVAPDHEADDCLAAFTHQAGIHKGPDRPYLTALLFTSDQDAYQLVSNRVAVGLLSSGAGTKYVNRAAVEAALGVKPWQVAAYKALCGCPTDCVPGVPGIGRVRAQQLLKDGSGLKQAIGKLRSPPVRGDLEAAKEAALLAHRLVTLRADAPVTRSRDECRL